MSSRNFCCRCNVSRSNSSEEFWPTPWYCKLLRPLTFFLVTAMLAISAVHLWAEFSATDSFWLIKADLVKLKNQLTTLSMEMKNVMETRDELRSKLREIGCVIPKMSKEIVKLKEEISEEIEVRTKIIPSSMSVDTVRDMVKNELQTYDADKTGRTDYALESLGGSIISTRNTEPYYRFTSTFPFFELCRQQNSPLTVIQAGSIPGQCWSFKGTSGSVAIRLMGNVRVTGVTLEHVASSLSPNGETTAAPRDFSVWGLKDADDSKGFLFGEYTYDNTASPVQYFPAQFQAGDPYEIIELRIHSNSGNPDYTCVYRIRVHGSLDSAAPRKNAQLSYLLLLILTIFAVFHPALLQH